MSLRKLFEMKFAWKTDTMEVAIDTISAKMWWWWTIWTLGMEHIMKNVFVAHECSANGELRNSFNKHETESEWMKSGAIEGACVCEIDKQSKHHHLFSPEFRHSTKISTCFCCLNFLWCWCYCSVLFVSTSLSVIKMSIFVCVSHFDYL